jgi:DNA-binding protein H-NS
MLLKDLFALRDKVEKVITKRVAKERKHIEGKLAELQGHNGTRKGPGRPPGKVDGRKKKRGKAAIKYRGPNAGETWAGRGLAPRWLTAYVKAGKKKDSFLIGTSRNQSG